MSSCTLESIYGRYPIVDYQSDLVYSVMIDLLAMEQCSVYSVDMPCSQAVVYVLYVSRRARQTDM